MDPRILVILLVVPVVVFAAKETICEGKEVRLNCKEGTIKIQDVMYGRLNKKTCKDSNISNTNCKSGKAEKRVKKQCEGQKTCNVVATNDKLGGDPCAGTSKYLEVKWKCQV